MSAYRFFPAAVCAATPSCGPALPPTADRIPPRPASRTARLAAGPCAPCAAAGGLMARVSARLSPRSPRGVDAVRVSDAPRRAEFGRGRPGAAEPGACSLAVSALLRGPRFGYGFSGPLPAGGGLRARRILRPGGLGLLQIRRAAADRQRNIPPPPAARRWTSTSSSFWFS